MSSIEERLARDIAAVTGDVVVTDSDLRKARDEVEDRIVIDRQRTRRRSGLVVAAAAVAIPVIGLAAVHMLDSSDNQPTPPSSSVSTSDEDVEEFLVGRSPTPDRVAGVWRVDNGTVLMQFTADGSFQVDDRGRLFADPGGTGTYAIDGDLITLTVDDGASGCAGQTVAMRASLPEPGSMRFVHTQPGTGNCVPENVIVDGAPAVTDNQWWELEQVLPTKSDYLANLNTSHEKGWEPLTANKPSLHGDWLAEGGGYVLELAPDGTYFIADESGDLADRGNWWLLPSKDLDLTSSGLDGRCSAGDRLVLGGLEQLNPGTLVIRGDVLLNNCNAPWTPTAWIQIPR